MDGIANHFPAKCTRFQIFFIYSRNIFPGGEGAIPPDARRIVPGACTHTPISLDSPAFASFPFYETTTALPFHCVHRKYEVGERLEPFSVGGETAFRCALLHFNHCTHPLMRTANFRLQYNSNRLNLRPPERKSATAGLICQNRSAGKIYAVNHESAQPITVQMLAFPPL